MFVPNTQCSNLTGGTPNSDGAIQVGVTLRVEDRSGATSTSNQQTCPDVYARPLRLHKGGPPEGGPYEGGAYEGGVYRRRTTSSPRICACRLSLVMFE